MPPLRHQSGELRLARRNQDAARAVVALQRPADGTRAPIERQSESNPFLSFIFRHSHFALSDVAALRARSSFVRSVALAH